MSAKSRLELRGLIRAQLDLDAVELPNTVIDPWLDDGFERTIAEEDRWPFLENTWTITTVLNQIAYTKASLAALDPNLYAIDQVSSLLDVTTSAPFILKALSQDRAEEVFGIGLNAGNVPAYWSEWAGSINVWPAPGAARTIKVRGYRKPNWAAGDSIAPDCDARLHLSLYYFACAMSYEQQEDSALAAEYMKHWADAVRLAHQKIMATPQRAPIIMSGSSVNVP